MRSSELRFVSLRPTSCCLGAFNVKVVSNNHADSFHGEFEPALDNVKNSTTQRVSSKNSVSVQFNRARLLTIEFNKFNELNKIDKLNLSS